MAFSSFPVSQLDPPNSQQRPLEGVGVNSQLPPPMPPRPTSGSIRPCSMAEQGRLTKLVRPETAQKCPRCDSTNTKFCYYNNYSLSQPRHLCKTCRRYWTRVGELRNVPVGGGRRSSKKSKTSGPRSKSTPVITGSSSTSGISSSSYTSDIIGHVPLTPLRKFPFLPPLHDHICNFGAGHQIGFSFEGVQPPAMVAAVGTAGRGGFGDKQQQFPYLAGLEPSSAAGIYQFQSEVSGFSDKINAAVLKYEENEGLDLPKKFLGNDLQYWSIGSALTDFDGFTSFSASNLF